MTAGSLVRLTAGGQVDEGFHSRINGGPNTTINSLAIGDNGKIVAGGSFTTFSGAVRNRLVRLLADGTLDTAFTANPGADAAVDVVVVLPGGKVLAGGNFVNYGGLGRSRLVLINGTGAAPGGEIEFSATGFRAAENLGQATIEVRRSGITTAAATVAYATANGTANAADYTARTGTLNFAAGETLKSFTVPILEDTLLEMPETVSLTLSNPGGGSILSVFRTATLTIEDNEIDTRAGAVDQTYGAQGSANGPIFVSLAVGDGTVLVGGNFSFIGGHNRNRLARLLTDGTVDPAFNPAIAFDGQVNALALQDGKIYAGGNFAEANAEPASRIVRLNADGTRDTGFTVGAGFNGTVNAMLPLTDGRVVVAGIFTSYQSQNRPYLTRLLGDGGIDDTFVAGSGPNGAIEAAALTGDGKILIGGSFTAYGGVTRNRVARVLANGGLDTDFDPGNGANSTVQAIYALPAGKVLIGGIFSTFAGGPAPFIARLLSTGGRDSSFSLNLPLGVTFQSYHTMTRAADGQIYLAGLVNDSVASSNRVIRLSENGACDLGFGTRTTADQRANTLLVTPGDTLLVGGSFTNYNGLPRTSLGAHQHRGRRAVRPGHRNRLHQPQPRGHRRRHCAPGPARRRGPPLWHPDIARPRQRSELDHGADRRHQYGTPPIGPHWPNAAQSILPRHLAIGGKPGA